jgi:iron complex outermembrane receptor protein
MMFRHKQISLGVMALCAGGFAATAVAQQQQPPTQPQTLQRVEVTGSNIKRIDAESVAPVQIITRDQIQRSGQPTIADVLRNIPANTGGSFGENFTNSFAPGSSGISLRGLGEKTTLVLINGRRVSSYGFAQNLQDTFVDLNSIPTSAVERVEILKDGASAIYGSDAIAGVVNIILRKDYKGFEASGGGGRASGKNEYTGTLTGGFGDLGADKFNVFGVLDYYHRDLIELSDTPFGKSRDYRGQPGGRNFVSLTGGGTWRLLTPAGGLTNTFKAISSCPGKVITGTDALAQGLTTSAAVGAATNTFCSHDFNDQFTAEPKTDRIGFLGRGTYEFSSNVSAYLELGLSRVKSFSTFQDPFFAGTTGLQSTPAGLVPFTYNINFAPGVAGNPFPTAARYSGVMGDLGTRNNDVTSDTGRLVAGLTYTLANWDLDSAAGYSRNKVTQISENNLTLSGVSAAFGVPTSPQPPVPTSTSSTYNLDDTTQNSAAVRNSLLINSPRLATSTLYFVDTKASTEFQQIKLPGGPLGLAIGAEFRHESLSDHPDAASTSGNILGLGTTATDGARSSEAIYAELRLPLLKNLEMQLAGRYDHYSDYGGSATPKVGFKYTPTDMVALRANYGRGFRAPSLPEISPSSATFFTQVIDPQTGNIANISGEFVGNPKLKAEKSTSLNYGIVFQPTKDASASVDFYRIRWNNIVGAPSFQQTVNDSCPNPPVNPGDPPCPSSPNVVRNPEDNTIVTVLTGYENISSRVTSGLDIDLTYAVPTVAFGKFTGHLDANYVLKFQEDGVDTNDSNAGFNTIPRLKASASLDWDYSAFSFTGRWNYTKGWTQAALPGSFFTAQNPAFQTGTYRLKTPDYYTFDIFGRYQITKNFSVNASVVNLMNRKPPYDPGFSGTFLYDFSEFDARGRLYRFNLTYKM